MTLKVRLAAMMVTILVAVLVLQFLLLERDRRETMDRLAEFGSGLDRTTALLVEGAYALAQRPGAGGLDSLLQRVAGEEGLGGGEAELTILVWSDSAESPGPDSMDGAGFHRVESFEETAVFRRPRGEVDSPDGESVGFLRSSGPDSLEVRREVEQVREFEVRQVVVSGSGSDSLRRSLAESLLVAPPGRGLDPGSRPPSRRLIRTETRFRSVGSDPKGTDMVINLPLPAASADSFLSLQVRYSMDTIQAELEGQRRRGLLWLGMVLGVGVLGTILVAGQFTRPIRALETSFRRVEDGDLSVHVHPERRDEIGRLTESFNEMVDRLRESREVESRLGEAERLAAVGRLAAGVAHEVRNPLNAIQLTMEQMRDTALRSIEGPEERARLERYHELASGEVTRLATLVSAFLDLARHEELELEELDAVDSLTSCVDLFRSQAAERGVEIVYEAAGPVVVPADRTRLPAVWNNLLSNALGATPAGGTIVIESRLESAEWVVTFRDSGPGVAPGDQGRIWDPFFSRRAQGTGLGLSIVRAVAEQHGGTVRFVPGPGGACFEVRLPRKGES